MAILLTLAGAAAAWQARALAPCRPEAGRSSPCTCCAAVAHVRDVYESVFAGFAGSREFATSQWARKPVLLHRVAGIAGSFTLDDVREAVDSDFLEAGLGVSGGGGGWKMTTVSEPRGRSYEEAKLRYVDVARGMVSGTVVFNSAGAHIPKLGAVCLAALDTFGALPRAPPARPMRRRAAHQRDAGRTKGFLVTKALR